MIRIFTILSVKSRQGNDEMSQELVITYRVGIGIFAYPGLDPHPGRCILPIKPKCVLPKVILESIIVPKERIMEEQPESENDHAQTSSTSSLSAERYVRIKRSYLYTALLPLTFVAGLASGFLAWGRSAEYGVPPIPDTTPDVIGERAPTRLEAGTDDDPALGPDDAQVVIVEFSDFSCPFCQKFHQETFADLMDIYAGQVRFVDRDFPIVGGGQVGFQAAQAANCAGEQGDYWTYHDALFSGRYNLDRSGFGQYASDLGLDTAELEDCLDSKRYAEEVRGDFQDGVDLGVTGTPTFFINGIPLVGAQPLSSFAQVIESELAR